MKRFLVVLCAISFFSCSKDDSSTSSGKAIKLLQNKWNIESVTIYANSNMSGSYMYQSTPVQQYEDFRTDGKVYTYGGAPVVYYDTLAYTLLPGDSLFLGYPIKNGVQATKADTGHIVTLSENSFIYYSINPAKEYGKWILKR